MLGGKGPFPWGLDRHDIISLWCTSRYGWTDDQVQNEPLQKYLYFPIMWAAEERIRAEEQAKQERQSRGNVR